MHRDCDGNDPRPDRLSSVTDLPFDPRSLVGSFFLSDHRLGWQGCVVAEPAPGLFLVETFDWLIGTSCDQQLVPIADMSGWTFYDTGEWMANAYNSGVGERWKSRRCQATGDAA